MAKYSYFDDFTPGEREAVKQRQLQHHQTWTETIKRFGHPKDWAEVWDHEAVRRDGEGDALGHSALLRASKEP